MRATLHLTNRSPMAHVTQGSDVPMKAMEKKRLVSKTEAKEEENKGAFHHCLVFFSSRWKRVISIIWAVKKAVPEAIAMRGLAVIERTTPRAKPSSTIYLAVFGP